MNLGSVEHSLNEVIICELISFVTSVTVLRHLFQLSYN